MAASALLAASGLPRVPADISPTLRALYRLADAGGVLFHGSQHGGLTELRDERRSRDATAYGDQTAVFASQDPVWALYFAVLRRGEGFRGTRNASLGPTRGAHGRRYQFSLDADRPWFAPGTIYVVSDEGFAHEPPAWGLLDTAHRTKAGSVTPIESFRVTPDDFPMRSYVLADEVGFARWPSYRAARRAARADRA